MDIFLTVLAVIGIVLASLVGLVILLILLLLPAKALVIAGYNKDDKFILKVKYLLFEIDFIKLFQGRKGVKPEPAAPETPATEKAEDTAVSKASETSETKSISDTDVPDRETAQPEEERKQGRFSRKLSLLKKDDYFQILGFIIEFIKRFRFRTIRININTGGDADKAAENYGRLTALIFPALGYINNNRKADSIDAHINAAFGKEKSEYDIFIELYARTFHILRLLRKCFFLIILKKDEGDSNGKQ